MDPKAAAKSKRAHTISGRRAHPTSAARRRHPSSNSSANPSSPRLPSNSARYDDGSDDTGEVGEPSSSGPSRPGDPPQARSKGADYAFLLQEARSRGAVQETGIITFDDSPLEFLQGSPSMLSIRGEGIIAWSQDDNFIVEDDTPSNFEVPFLSMDLHALARKLSKAKLSERLFIEPDFFPEEMETVEHPASEFSESAPRNYVEAGTASKEVPVPPQYSYNRVADVPSNLRDAKSESSKNTAEASKVEAELDFLLDSLSEAKISDNMAGTDSPNAIHVDLPNSSQNVQDGAPSVSNAVSSLHDDIDELFATVLPIKMQQKAVVPSQSYGSIVQDKDATKSNSYTQRDRMSSPLDDLIDDLLAETSPHIKAKALPEHGAAPAASLSSKPLDAQSADDFDSWFDTL